MSEISHDDYSMNVVKNDNHSSEVVAQIGEIDKLIGDISQALDDLTKKLDPILTGSNTDARPERPVPVMETRLGVELLSHVNRLENLVSYINDIHLQVRL